MYSSLLTNLNVAYLFNFDPDAQAFITAAGITNATEQTAINNLVVQLKADNLWNSFFAIWPLVGGTSSSCKYNLKDPRDLNAAFRLEFNGTWSFSSNGIKGNGTNTFAKTFFTPQNFTNYYSNSLGVYMRETLIGTSYVNMPMAAYDGSGNCEVFQWTSMIQSNSIGLFDPYAESQRLLINPGSDPRGLTWVTQQSSTGTMAIVKNTTVLGSRTRGTDSCGTLSQQFYLGARNNNNIADYHTGNQYAFAFIGSYIPTTSGTILYNAIQNFQTALGRQV